MRAQFERFSINMTMKQAKSASHQGDCLCDVLALCSLPDIKRQLAKITDADIIAELSEYGAWESDEMQLRHENEERIIWIAAGNIVEESRK
jgi:hypothetical protein